MAYDIYTYGNGEILQGVFNAIAMCLKKDGGTLYEAMIRLGLIVGVMWAVVYAIYGDIVKLFSSWILPLSVFNIILFAPTATVMIKDPVTNFQKPVANVPYGLAIFASYTSRIGYGITEQVEKIFNLSDNIKYQKTGHVFASNLIHKAKTLHITNEEVAENMRQFVGHCVAYDALLGRKYTIQDLRNSSDIWGLVSANASPVRSFLWKEPRDEKGGGGAPSILSCKDGVVKFNKLWPGEITKTATWFGKKMFGKNGGVDAKAQILQSLPIVYNELGNMSQGATDILKQQMMINSVIDGIDQQSTAMGNASNFAARRAYLHQRSTYETLGAMAGDTLPIMKAVLEAIAYSVFIFIVPLALLPFGWRFILSWGQIILWLQMWAPLYAILNYIMTMAAKAKTLTAMSMSNEAGITIASSVGVANANADISAMAGYLAMSIPFLCIAIVKGVGSFVTMASHLGNVTQGSAAMAAGEATSGNYSFGNISEGNVQMANTSMLQQSHAASYRSGSFQHADGRTDMITASDGSQMINVSSSNIPISLNVAESQSAQLSEMQNQTWQQGLSQSQASSQNIANSIRNSASLNESIRASENAGNSVSQGISTEQSQALNKSQQYVTDFAKQHNINEEKAANLFAEASAGGGVFIKGSAGGRTSVNSSDQKMLQDVEKVTQSQDYQQAVRESAQAAKSLSHTLTDEKTRNLAADVAGSYEKGMQQREEAAKNFSASENYGRQAMMTKANSASINANHNQQFVEWLSKQKADNTNGTIGKHGAAHIIANDPQKTMGYANNYMAEKGVFPGSPVTSSPASIQQGYNNEIRHQPLAPINDAPLYEVQQAGHSLTQNHSLNDNPSPSQMNQPSHTSFNQGGSYSAGVEGLASYSPTSSAGENISYSQNDGTSSIPQPSSAAPSGQGASYSGTSQGTPSFSGSGSSETYTGGQVTSSPTATLTGGSGSYGASDNGSSTPTATSQPSYTPPAERNILYADSNIPISQAGADFRAKVEGNIQLSQQDIQIGASEIRKNSDPVKQKVNDAQGTSIHNNLKKKLGEESLKSIHDAHEYLTDKKNITGEK